MCDLNLLVDSAKTMQYSHFSLQLKGHLKGMLNSILHDIENVCMDGWMDGFMDLWIDGSMDALNPSVCTFFKF